ncbi:MAG: biopolymer transporter ExbD [candidate division Zixibacteria bacterium]|nr:biopolymer transporter ExbD [candidate division Zixibacteria bacterium]
MQRRRVRRYNAYSDINIANLVDVVLVLLIIFMISAPLLQSGIEVDLPKTRAAIIDSEAQGVVVSIDTRGGIYINDVWVRLDNLETALDEEMRSKNTSMVYLRADSTITYGLAIQVIARIKEMGIDAISLVTTPLEENSTKRKK